MSAAHDDHGHDDHGHGHSPWIQHHYDDAQHQFDSGKLGIWLFLAQEVLFFSALFVAYVLYRHHHPEIYGYAHKYLDVKFGAINTAVLIFSSLTAAWAVRAAQLRQRMLLVACLATTILCACTFLVIKYIEYTHKVHEHLLFGRYFDPCVAANESPLITRNNECPGSKGSVMWDYEKAAPELGCFPTLAVDQSPKEGAQVDCLVSEVELQMLKNEKDEPIVDLDTKGHKFSASDDLIRTKLQTAKDADKPGLEKQLANMVVKERCEPSHGEGEEEHGGPACWRTSYQPAVCRPGWFYTQRCVAGPVMLGAEAKLAEAQQVVDDAKKKLKDAEKTGNKDLIKKAGDAVTEAETKLKEPEALARLARGCIPNDREKQLNGGIDRYTFSNWAGDRSECNDALNKRIKALKAVVDAEMLAKCPKDAADHDQCQKDHAKDPDLTSYTHTECAHSEQVGLLVEHHDHEVRPASIVVKGTCKAPPKPNVEGDPFVDKPQQLALGVKAAGGEHVKSTHEEHEELYGGPPPEHTGMFFTIYFAMTGLHGVHVLVGVFIFIWLLIRAIKGHFTPEYFGPVDWAALYWHIVDLIWIFLFPLMYLIH